MSPTADSLEHWSLAGDAVLEGCRIFRRPNLIGGKGSLREGLEVLQPYPTSCLLSSSSGKIRSETAQVYTRVTFRPRPDELCHLKL